ncbi:DNA translocase FtsK [Patescibacteria group bacterium]
MVAKRRVGRPRKNVGLLSQNKTEGLNPEIRQELIGFILMVLGLILMLAVFGFAGSIGNLVGQFLKIIFGQLSYVLPLFLLVYGGWFVFIKNSPIRQYSIFGTILFVLATSSLLHLYIPSSLALSVAQTGAGGGLLGFSTALIVSNIFGHLGATIIFIGTLLISAVLIFNISLGDLFNKFVSMFRPQNPEVGEDGEIVKPTYQGFSIFKLRQNKKVEEKTDTSPANISDQEYDLPPIDILEERTTEPKSGDTKVNSEKIKDTLANFNLDVAMAEIHIGPTVTQYTLKPAPSVKLNQITARANDIALALAAHPIRIEAPIPGKSAVGIEIPNKVPAIVRMRSVFETDDIKKSDKNLNFALGQDVAGEIVSADLTQMPHLLIAGSTGSGKSVCLNSIITSLLFQHTPKTLNIILVDPKRVEFAAYNGIPHLLIPAITEVDKTINVLRWVVNEMEDRYKTLAENNKRNLEAYNKNQKEPMPFMIVIIDELADLMALSSREVEGSIVRLAQKARAVGIHLVIATQRPSVEVITGLIKANITSRIAFAVASQVDSRTILDMSGAEKLLGNGDMLYMASDTGKPKRIQGAFISEKEVNIMANFWRNKEKVTYNNEILEYKAKSENGSGVDVGDFEDDLFEEAKKLVVTAQKASASLLQRRLRIGYARAARLLDMLEDKGVIGPADGARPREVLIDKSGEFRFDD